MKENGNEKMENIIYAWNFFYIVHYDLKFNHRFEIFACKVLKHANLYVCSLIFLTWPISQTNENLLHQAKMNTSLPQLKEGSNTAASTL